MTSLQNTRKKNENGHYQFEDRPTSMPFSKQLVGVSISDIRERSQYQQMAVNMVRSEKKHRMLRKIPNAV